MTNKILNALNDQLHHEASAFYAYLAKAAHFESQGFKGFAKWFRAQAIEEQGHMMKFYDFIHVRGGSIKFQDLKASNGKWKSAKEVFKDSLKAEQNVTAQINQLVNLAIAEKDHATHQFLLWFVNEQIEEEATVVEILQKFDLIGDNNIALIMLDKELGSRDN